MFSSETTCSILIKLCMGHYQSIYPMILNQPSWLHLQSSRTLGVIKLSDKEFQIFWLIVYIIQVINQWLLRASDIIVIYFFIPWTKGIYRCSKYKAYLLCTVSPSHKATIIAIKIGMKRGMASILVHFVVHFYVFYN